MAATDYGVLHSAARSNDVEKLSALLADPAVRVNAADPSDGFTALHYAARGNSFGALYFLLNNGADVNAKTLFRWTPLHLAAYNGHDAAVRWLLYRGADATLKDANGETPAEAAVRGNHPAIATLLAAPEKVVQQYKRQMAAFEAINTKSLPDLLRAIAQQGFDINFKYHPEGPAVLGAAIGSQFPEAVTLLLEKGADPNQKYGSIPLLFIAVYEGNRTLFDALIAKGADIDVRYNETTLLQYATDQKKTEFVELLKKQ
jgi:cytohesin